MANDSPHSMADSEVAEWQEGAYVAEVGERALRRAHEVALLLGEGVGEVDEEAAIALALVGGQREYAGQIVVVAALLVLGEIAYYVVPASSSTFACLGNPLPKKCMISG